MVQILERFSDRRSSEQSPISTAAETTTRETFQALMWALSYPGKSYGLPLAHSVQDDHRQTSQPLQPFVAIAQTLLDLEVSYFTPVSDLDPYLTQTLAQPATVDKADYHFYPYRNFLDDPAHLQFVAEAKFGTLLYPDQSATVILACRIGSGQRLCLSGPGIHTTTELMVDGIPAAFWSLRAARIYYPLGIDLLLVDGPQIVGMPRTTVIEWQE
ncbi:MAG: phosphonate C-P lyase system protein PhnH [Caldilineaceae bacterium]